MTTFGFVVFVSLFLDLPQHEESLWFDVYDFMFPFFHKLLSEVMDHHPN